MCLENREQLLKMDKVIKIRIKNILNIQVYDYGLDKGSNQLHPKVKNNY